MNDFIAKAHVTSDWKNISIKEVKRVILDLGYDTQPLSKRNLPTLFINEGLCLDVGAPSCLVLLGDFIDCNAYTETEEDAVKLFLELAVMDGSEGLDRGQWFTDGDNGLYKCISRKIKNDLLYEVAGEFNDEYMRKAYPIELAEAVKNKEIIL